MSVIIHIYYHGENGAPKKFADEMIKSGIVDDIRRENGNEQYDYFIPFEDSQTLLLIDKWESQNSLDAHHASPMMERIAVLREKYDLHMEVERCVSDNSIGADDGKFIRR